MWKLAILPLKKEKKQLSIKIPFDYTNDDASNGKGNWDSQTSVSWQV